MEAGYANHQSASASGLDVDERMLSISMTATMDTTGNLILGNLAFEFHESMYLLNS